MADSVVERHWDGFFGGLRFARGVGDCDGDDFFGEEAGFLGGGGAGVG